MRAAALVVVCNRGIGEESGPLLVTRLARFMIDAVFRVVVVVVDIFLFFSLFFFFLLIIHRPSQNGEDGNLSL